MAYKIKLGTFSKLQNSTAQPSIENWAEYDVTLKEGADISNPTITLSIGWTAAKNYNYAYFMNRYYYIVGKNLIRENLCVFDLKIDVLATWKTQIGNSNLYVLRSASASNGYIRDNYYPIKANATCYHDVQEPNIVDGHETSIPGDYDSGVIILNVSGTRTAGTSTLLQMLPSAFMKLIVALYRDINGFQLSDMVAKVVQKFGGNPQALINGAMWFPFPFDVVNVEQVCIGSWPATDENGNMILGGVVLDPIMTLPDVNFTIYRHPLAATRGSYLNLRPYTQYTLGLPGCGVIDLDNVKLQGQSTITIRRVMDAFSGQMLEKVTTPNYQVLAYMNAQIGIPLDIQSSNNAESLVSGITSTVGSIVAGIATGGAATLAGAAASGIATAMEAAGGTATSSNVGGGFASIVDERIWLDTVCADITNEDAAEFGRPLCETRTPASLGGFMIVSEGNVKIPGPLPEQQEIKNFLETGFYYE